MSSRSPPRSQLPFQPYAVVAEPRRGLLQEYISRKVRDAEAQGSPKSRLGSLERAFQFEPGRLKPTLHRRTSSNQASPRTPQLGNSQRLSSVRENSPLVIRPGSTPRTSRLVLKNQRQASNERLTTMTTAATVETEEKSALVSLISSHFQRCNECPPTSLEFYRVGKLIGKGAFGKVVSGMQKLTGCNVALKAIDKEYLADENHRRKVFQEIFILNKFRHRRIVKILEVFESENHLLIAMEYAPGGDLLQYVKSRHRLPESEARPLFHQIIEGALAIHNTGVLHRDFKLDNILLNSDKSHIKICDFGVSRVMRRGQKVSEQCGTPAYIAPEIIADHGYEGFYSDIWSLGVCLYAMVSGSVPFKAASLRELHKLVLTARYQMPEGLTREVKDLIEKMLHLVPSRRITLEEVLRHEWFQGQVYEDCGQNEDGMKEALNPDLLTQVHHLGFPQDKLLTSLRLNEMNHGTASYYLLLSSFQ